MARGKLPADFLSVAARYRSTAAEAVAHFEGLDYEGCCFEAPPRMLELQHHLHNTLIYLPPPTWARGRSALTPGKDWARVEREFLEGRTVVVDDVLAPWALDAVQTFLLEATIFNELKHGYVGAYAADGLTGGVFAQITRELRTALPEIVGHLELCQFWSYKYSNIHEGNLGIDPHADMAYVNLNLWVTPDDASLNQTANGMTVFDYGADTPDDFALWQNAGADERMATLQRDEGVADTRVPYRCNRVVLFNSRLVHQTGVPGGTLAFKNGYTNRRINLTWLFGRAVFSAHQEGTVYDGRGRFVAEPPASEPPNAALDLVDADAAVRDREIRPRDAGPAAARSADSDQRRNEPRAASFSLPTRPDADAGATRRRHEPRASLVTRLLDVTGPAAADPRRRSS